MRDWEKKLCEDFPIFFGEKDLPMTQSLMCFGCECDKGWEPLIREVAEKAEEWNKANPDQPVTACQIKEKFAGLRIYTSGCPEVIYTVIQKMESLSYKTCEECGSTEGKRKGDGWLYTRCDKCWEKMQSKKVK